VVEELARLATPPAPLPAMPGLYHAAPFTAGSAAEPVHAEQV
jgi:hypothetical protein